MNNTSICHLPEIGVGKPIRCHIPRQFWSADMWELDRQKKRDREKTRKRHYQMAFGQLKRILSVDQSKTCHVDVLRMAREKIVSLAEQYFELKKKNIFTPEPLSPPDNDIPSTKRRKIETVPFEIVALPPPLSPLPPEGSSNYRL